MVASPPIGAGEDTLTNCSRSNSSLFSRVEVGMKYLLAMIYDRRPIPSIAVPGNSPAGRARQTRSKLLILAVLFRRYDTQMVGIDAPSVVTNVIHNKSARDLTKSRSIRPSMGVIAHPSNCCPAVATLPQCTFASDAIAQVSTRTSHDTHPQQERLRRRTRCYRGRDTAIWRPPSGLACIKEPRIEAWRTRFTPQPSACGRTRTCTEPGLSRTPLPIGARKQVRPLVTGGQHVPSRYCTRGPASTCFQPSHARPHAAVMAIYDSHHSGGRSNRSPRYAKRPRQPLATVPGTLVRFTLQRKTPTSKNQWATQSGRAKRPKALHSL